MNLAVPTFLWLALLVAPVLALFFVWAWRQRQRAIRQFISSRLLAQLTRGVSPRRQIFRMTLIGVAMVSAIASLSRPQWGTRWEEAKQRGLDIIVAIDTSRSMLAADVPPNRIERAKLETLSLLDKARSDRFGLVAFAGSAFLQCPLTLDDEAFRQSLRALDVNIIPQGGTALGPAITAALEAFREAGENMKVLILITDGEDHEAGAVDIAKAAADEGVRIFTIGVGSAAGELIRVRDEAGNETFLTDENGNAVKSRLNENLLREIATVGKGFFLPLRGPDTVGTLYDRGLEPLPRADFQARMIRQRKERFYWPLGFAILLLIVEMLIPERPKQLKNSVAPSGRIRAAAGLWLLASLGLFSPLNASPAAAQKAYQRGDYKGALAEYERLLTKSPREPRLSYNAGNAAFQAGLYGRATELFADSLTAPDLQLQQQAFYNLGNASYRLGEQAETPDEKTRTWQRALDNYKAAMELNPADADAQFNHDLVKRKLEELQKQQQQQQNQQQASNDQKDQKDDRSKQQDKKSQQQQPQNSQPKQAPQKKESQPKSEQKSQQQAQQKNQPKDGAGNQQKDKGAPKKGDGKKDETSEPELNPGQLQYAVMTQQQAENMLDAQRSEDRILIFGPAKLTNQPTERLLKNW